MNLHSNFQVPKWSLCAIARTYKITRFFTTIWFLPPLPLYPKILFLLLFNTKSAREVHSKSNFFVHDQTMTSPLLALVTRRFLLTLVVGNTVWQVPRLLGHTVISLEIGIRGGGGEGTKIRWLIRKHSAHMRNQTLFCWRHLFTSTVIESEKSKKRKNAGILVQKLEIFESIIQHFLVIRKWWFFVWQLFYIHLFLCATLFLVYWKSRNLQFVLFFL